jgi:putative ABC transport system permease protein
MTRITLAGLWAHKRRLIGMLLAVFFGVAFLAGTLALGDTMRSSIKDFIGASNAGTDVLVRNATQVSDSPAAGRGAIDAGVLDRVRAVDGVAVAEPQIQGFAQIVGHDGAAVSVNGPRTASNWVEDPQLNPYRIVEGRPPRTASEVVVNRGAADAGDLRVGDATTVLTPRPVPVTVVGIATFGDSNAFGGTSYVGFSLDAARRYLTTDPGKITSVAVEAAPGVSQDELVSRIAAALPSGVQAVSGTRATDESFQSVDDGFLTFFRTFLSIFAAVAMLVAVISIHNTFAIVVAQRLRESALLRAIGAARGQVLRAVVVEALVIGAVGTALGVAAGIGLAALLKGAFAGLGFDLPTTRLVFTATTGVVSAVVGVLATLVAAVTPALRASRVPPLAALREVAAERTRASTARVVIGGVLGAAGVGTALTAVGGGDGSPARAGIGAVLVLAAMVTLGPAVAAPASRLIGAPAARLRGVAGLLARRNAMRNPRRTAGAASALMVGVGVVTLVTAIAASQSASIDRGVRDSFTGDLAVSASNFGNGGVSPRLAEDLGRIPGVRTAVGVTTGNAEVDGSSVSVNAASLPDLATVVRLDGTVPSLSDGQIAVSRAVADDRGWRVGRQVSVVFADGAAQRFTIGGVYDSTPVLGGYLLPSSAWAAHVTQSLDAAIYLRLADGVDAGRAKDAVVAAARPYGAPTVQDRQEFVDASTQNVRALLNVVYVMLVLAIVIALMGIANTLSLSVYERTRELGLLRAIGATRPQVRSMVRWESVITALLGTVSGLALGAFLGWVLVRSTADPAAGGTSFSAPAGPLVAVLAGGLLAGLLAGLAPARRAARLPYFR